MKQKFPLEVLEILEKYVEKTGEDFEILEPEKLLLKAIGSGSNSEFYYNIEEYKMVNGETVLLVDRRPNDKKSTGNSKKWVPSRNLDQHFAEWVGFLKRYKTVKSFYDDPILEHFAKEYYEYFEIIDDDAETTAFLPEQILLIDEHLEAIVTVLDDKETPENKERLLEIKNQINIIRGSLTTKSKKWIVKHISRVWGGIAKEGTEFLKGLTTEIKKLAQKEAAKGIFNLAKKAVALWIDLS